MDSHNFIEENLFPVPARRASKVLFVGLCIVLLAGFILVGHWDRQRLMSQTYYTFTQ